MDYFCSDLEFEQAEFNGKKSCYFEENRRGVRILSSLDGEVKGKTYAVEFTDSSVKFAIVEARKRLKRLITFGRPDTQKILVVGIGNSMMTSDSLGTATVELVVKNNLPVKTFLPSVEGVTGIPSDSLVRAVIKECDVEGVIAVDSLCAGAYRRIGKVVQMTDKGIVAGSAVTNYGRKFNDKNFGVPVIAIGVPVVVSVAGLLKEQANTAQIEEGLERLIVAPKDVDRVITRSAEMIFSILKGALLHK